MEKKDRLLHNARRLRKQMTKEERHLWYDFLAALPVTVNRQKVLGSYIVDFFISSAKIAIELDGTQHYIGEGISRDQKRDAWLNEHGITVLRYTNLQINRQFSAVCEDIARHIQFNMK